MEELFRVSDHSSRQILVRDMVLFQIFLVEGLYLVERNHIHMVIQVGVDSSGHNQQFLVVTRKQLEGILTEITGMGILSMHEQDRTSDLVCI